MFDREVVKWKEEEYPRKIKAFLYHAEGKLGTEEGELERYDSLLINLTPIEVSKEVLDDAWTGRLEAGIERMPEKSVKKFE